MKTYRKYYQNEDHVWYDSTNVVYSVAKAFGDSITLKVVFKAGRTYVYRKVTPVDYVMFRDSQSSGSSLLKYIIDKKYECIKVDDTNLENLDALKTKFQGMDDLASNIDIKFEIEANENSGDAVVKVNGEPIYYYKPNEADIVNFLTAIGVKFIFKQTDIHQETEDEFINKHINI